MKNLFEFICFFFVFPLLLKDYMVVAAKSVSEREIQREGESCWEEDREVGGRGGKKEKMHKS